VKKKLLLVLLAMVLIVSLVAFAACAAPAEEEVEEEAPPVEEEAPPVEEEEEVWEWPDKLVIASTGEGFAGFAVATAWATLLAADTGMKIRIVTEETQIRMNWVRDCVAFCTGQGLTPHSIMLDRQGNASREGAPWQARTIYPITKSSMGYVVRGDSPIKTPDDIKPGTKFIYLALGPARSGLEDALVAWCGLDPEDIVWIPASSFDACTRFIMDGKGDISYGNPTSPAWFEAEASPRGIRWLELDAKKYPAAAQRFIPIFPASPISFIPADSGVPSAIGVTMVSLVCPYTASIDQDPELVYHLIKWLDENRDRYKDSHPWCPYMNVDLLLYLAEHDAQPLHEGAVKYLRELGLWTDAREARRQYNIDLLTRWVEAYQDCLDLADEKGIEVDPFNEEWMKFWADFSKDLPKATGFPSGLD